MSDDNSSLSFPFRQNNDEMSEYAHDYLTEHQEEISNNFNFDKPGFDPSGLFYDEKTTNISASNTSQSSKSNPSSEIKSENNSERSTNSSATDKKEKINFKSLKIYLVDDINKTIKQMNLKEETENKLILDKDKKTKETEEIFTELHKEKKRVRGKKNKKINKIEEPKDIECGKKILGRKRKDDTTVGERTKYSSYNIIKKIKNKIIHNILMLVNRVIKSLYTKEQINQILNELHLPEIKSYLEPVIKKIEHKKFANETKRDENIKFLNKNIKDLLSNNVSGKFKALPSNSNELIISRLLQEEDNKDIFDFIFNELTVGDFLDIFTKKTELISLPKISLNNKEIEIIEESLEKIDSLLLKVLEEYNGDRNYYHCFTILIYNFKEFLDNKESREKKKKNE